MIRARRGRPAIGALAGFLCLLVASCAAKVDVDQPSPFEEDDPAAFDPNATIDRTSDTASATGRRGLAQDNACARPRQVERRRSFAVTSTQLQRTLDAGPGIFLRGVDIKPRFIERQFIGWEIIEFMPCENRFDSVDLRPGDVIGRVNQRELARPEHLASLWAELRTARVITVDISRSDGDFQLRFEVSDDAKPARP